MAQAFVPELLGRSDYAIISELIEPNTRVLDLGCGEGELLEWLALHKRVDARGVEISGPKAQQAIARGVSVFHSDLEEALADLPDRAFDYVILSQTLQETREPLKVLHDMLRVGEHAIVAYGYDSYGIYVMDVGNGEFYHTDWASFLRRWGYLDRMALVIRPGPTAVSLPRPR